MRVNEQGLDEFEEAPPTQPVLCALDELEARPQWVAWKYEERNGRTTKPPINPHRGGYADSTNPKTWGTYVQAVAAAQERRLAGVGYVLSGDDDFVGYDLDKCRNPQTGWIKPWAREILSYAETYAELSPSGTGIRLIARGELADAIKCDPAKVEVYGKERYLTITRQRLDGAPDAIRPAPKTLATCAARAERHQKTWATLAAVGPDIATAVKTEAVKERKGSLTRGLAAFKPRAKAQASNGAGQGGPRKRGVLWEAIYGFAKDPFFRNVKDAALQNLSAWVPALFGAAARATNKGYRVSSAALGRDLEEDLSITPQGIKDFGVYDMGDERGGKRTPIDLVLEYGQPKTAADAALWLCDRLGIEPASIGWRGNADGASDATQDAPPIITRLRDWLERDLPSPDLVQGNVLSTTTRALLWAPTGIGKTLLGVASGWPCPQVWGFSVGEGIARCACSMSMGKCPALC